jgi:hypothetical protein
MSRQARDERGTHGDGNHPQAHRQRGAQYLSGQDSTCGASLPVAHLLLSTTCERAGIQGLRFHDLRHEAASRFFEKGLSVMEAASVTGHKDLRMLKRYTRMEASRLGWKAASGSADLSLRGGVAPVGRATIEQDFGHTVVLAGERLNHALRRSVSPSVAMASTASGRLPGSGTARLSSASPILTT